MTPKEITERLRSIQKLEEAARDDGDDAKKTASRQRKTNKLRKDIPEMILDHYDRLRLAGRKGIASAEGLICRSCSIKLPRGERRALTLAADLIMCENCAAYLYLESKTTP